MNRYYLLFTGRVQGVGFRYTLSQLAHRYSLTGEVRNLSNGNVSLEIQGDEKAIDTFLKEVLKDRLYIHIEDYRIKKIPIKEETSFIVR